MYQTLAKSLGAFWISQNTAIRLLSRILAVEDPKDLYSMMRVTAAYRIKQAKEFLEKVPENYY